MLAKVCDPTLEETEREEAWRSYRLVGVDVVKFLAEAREWLTADDVKVRAQAMKALARALDESTTLEPRAEVAGFLKSRADDPTVSASAFRGLRRCLAFERAATGSTVVADLALETVFAVPIGAYGQRTRQRAWDLLDDLIRFPGNKAPGNLAEGIAAAIDGEKDPRCLLRALRCAEIAATKIQDAKIVFDALEPYFPISFEPPKNDPWRISPERLRRALRRALTATPTLADRAVGAALGKLLEDEEAIDPKDHAEALRLLAKALHLATLTKFRQVATQAGALLIVRKTTNDQASTDVIEAAQFQALESLASRAAAEGCFNLLDDTVMTFLADEPKPETVAGRFARKVAMALAKGGAWRSVFDAFGGRVVDKLLLLLDDDDDDEKDHVVVAAALEALVELLEIPHPALTFPSVANFERCIAVLSPRGGGGEDDDVRVEALRLRGFAALAERRILRDDEVVTSLVTACIVANDPRRLHLIGRIAAARPQCAAAVMSTQVSSRAIIALAAAPEVLQSSALLDTVRSDSTCFRDLRHSMSLARKLDPATTNRVLVSILREILQKSDDVPPTEGLADLVDDLVDFEGLARDAASVFLEDPQNVAALTILRVAFQREGDLELPDIGPVAAKFADENGAAPVLVGLFTRQPVSFVSAELAAAPVFRGRWTCAARVALGEKRRRGDPTAAKNADAVLTSLADALLGGNSRGEAAASAVARILALPAPKNFDARFWRQRFYAGLTPRLMEPAGSSSPSSRKAILALARAAPRPIVLRDAGRLVNVVVAGLDDDENPGLGFLKDLLDAVPAADALRPHLDVALPKILHLSCAATNRVKVDALRCLNALATNLPHDALFPFRRSVALALRKPLDDDNKDLRRLAALVRNDWLANFGGAIV